MLRLRKNGRAKRNILFKYAPLVQIAPHLKGTWSDEHLFNLERHLEHYDHLQQILDRYEQQIILRLQQLSPAERQDQSVPAHPNARKEKDMRRRAEEPLRTALWRFCGIDLSRIDGISSEGSFDGPQRGGI